MDGRVGRLVAGVSVDRTAAGVILDFLNKEGPADKMRGGIGGVMGAGMRMMAARLSMSEARRGARQFSAYAREKIGGYQVGKIVGAIPGLAQFV